MPKTEDEARQLWCPHARVVVSSEMHEEHLCSANRLPGVGNAPDPDLEWPSPRCIASDCMMWQPYYDPAPGEAVAAIKRRRAETGCGLKEAKDWWDTLPQNGTRGDCGLKR